MKWNAKEMKWHTWIKCFKDSGNTSKPRTNPRCLPQPLSILLLDTWSLTEPGSGWFTSKPLRSSCLYLFSMENTGVRHHTWLFMWGEGIRTQFLGLAQKALYCLSHCRSPYTVLEFSVVWILIFTFKSRSATVALNLFFKKKNVL